MPFINFRDLEQEEEKGIERETMVTTPERVRQAAERRTGAMGFSEKSLRMVVAGVNGGCGGGDERKCVGDVRLPK
jgi:hypothetical protein